MLIFVIVDWILSAISAQQPPCLSLCFPNGDIYGDSLTKSSIVWRYTCPAGNSRNSAKFPVRATLRRQRVHKARLSDITISTGLLPRILSGGFGEKPIRKAGFEQRLIFFLTRPVKFPPICLRREVRACRGHRVKIQRRQKGWRGNFHGNNGTRFSKAR